jgi:hypothetical protein
VAPNSAKHVTTPDASALVIAWKNVGLELTTTLSLTNSALVDRVTALHVFAPPADSSPKHTTARDPSRAATAL